MPQTLALDAREVVLELHRLLRDLDPARFHDELREAARKRVASIATRLHELSERAPAEASRLQERIAEVRASLQEHAPGPGLPTAAARRAAWASYHEALKPRYEALAASLRDYRVHVPSLRPTNYVRNAFHLVWAGVALFLIEAVLDPRGLSLAAGGFMLYAWTMEGARRLWPAWNERLMKLYGPVAHPHEWHRVNSATWYATALVGLTLTGSLTLCAVGVAILGVADPAAAIIGRRWGRVKLVNGRSLEGSLTFVFTATLVTAPLLALRHDLPWSVALPVVLSASLTGALAELFSRRLDDNLTIPLAAAAGAWLSALALGVSLL